MARHAAVARVVVLQHVAVVLRRLESALANAAVVLAYACQLVKWEHCWAGKHFVFARETNSMWYKNIDNGTVMLSQLYETAMLAQQDAKDVAKPNTKSPHIPFIKRALKTAARNGELVVPYVFTNTAPEQPFSSANNTIAIGNTAGMTGQSIHAIAIGVAVPIDDIDEATVTKILNEWFAEEPEWSIPFAFTLPERITVGYPYPISSTSCRVWFDLREPNDYVFK